jgi:predicted NAD/FAD-binding protein
VDTQRELPDLNGRRHTFFCGSYFGHGFHEDAVKSGANVAKAFGIEL